MSYKEKPQIKLYKYENRQFVLQAQIDDYADISFEHNLYQAGVFTITINYNIPNALLFQRGLFVQFGNNAYDFGEIVKINDSIGADGKGSQIRTITGYDARYILKRRVIKNMNSNGLWVMTAKGELCLRNLIKDQCGAGAEAKRQLPIINTIPASADAIGKEYSVSEQFTNLYEVCKTIATQSEIGWRIAFNGSLTLEVYAGSDLSQTVRFDTNYESLANGEFSDSSESFSNAIYIGGKGQNDNRDIYEGEDGTPSGFDRFESWDNQSQMTTESEYEAEALSMLSQYGQTLTMAGNGLAKCPYIFREQYDIGDIITVAFSGKSAVAQILSVTEHWAWGSYDIQFSFGKPQNNLAEQLQLMLRQIQKASEKASSTDSVRWYTLPTDSSMPKADVTYSTIGFTGSVGSGKTFTLYLDNEKTGSKTYHVYFKQLGGTGKLTLTTGKTGATNLVMEIGTYVVIIYVDENGNITSQGMTATSSVSSGNSQPVTSGGVASAINALNVLSVGSSSFKARQYSNIVNNTEYEFADINAVADGVTALVSIVTTSTGNVCHSLWLVSTGNTGETCGITLLCKSGYGGNNQTKLTVNWNAGGSCSLVLRLVALNPSYEGNAQLGYISLLCLNGSAVLKEKTTTLTNRVYTKYLYTDRTDKNSIITDTLIQATVTESKKANVLASFSTNSLHHYKISGLMVTNTENVFLLQSRAGELLILSCGYGDGGASIPPKIKRILNTYTKIAGFTYSGSDVFMRVEPYSHDCVFSQLAGLTVASLTITDATEAQYNAGTPITIET